MRQHAFLLSVLAASMAAPLAFAHWDQGGPGTPDFTCQSISEWYVHDYGPPAAFDVVYGVRDGNIEECGVTFGTFVLDAQQCAMIGNSPAPPPVHALLCRTDRPMDFDGDFEFALGGALLAVESGDGSTGGSLACYGLVGHHSTHVRAVDVGRSALGLPVAISVSADASLVPPPPGVPDCGDGTVIPCREPTPGGDPVVDAVFGIVFTLLNQPGSTCNPRDRFLSCPGGDCGIPFGPGSDGSYVVYVGRPGAPATLGHIFSP